MVDVQDAAAFGDDASGGDRIDMSIFTQFVRAAEDAIVPARDDVHERSIVGDDRAVEIADLGNDSDLSAVRFKIEILNEFFRANAGAVDHQIERKVDVFQLLEANAIVD